MIEIVDKCLAESNSFSLFVQGALSEDTRRLVSFKIGTGRKQNLPCDQVTRFNLIDFRLQMHGKFFDFVEIPSPETHTEVVWKFTKIKGKPKHVDWLRSKASHGLVPQTQVLKPLQKEFSVA